jgi:hypothetical protein
MKGLFLILNNSGESWLDGLCYFTNQEKTGWIAGVTLLVRRKLVRFLMRLYFLGVSWLEFSYYSTDETGRIARGYSAT